MEAVEQLAAWLDRAALTEAHAQMATQLVLPLSALALNTKAEMFWAIMASKRGLLLQLLSRCITTGAWALGH